MGDSARKAAFDDAYRVVADVGLAEDYANQTVARVRRSHLRVAGLVVAVAGLFVVAVAVLAARSGGGTKGTVHSAAPIAAGSAEPTTTEAPTTPTTIVLMQPPLEAVPAPVSSPTTMAPVRRATPTTSAVVTPSPSAPAASNITLAEVWPPSRNPARVYMAARGRDPAGYVSQMTIDWGDGSTPTKFSYPLSSCQAGVLQAANVDHGYAAPGIYQVQLFVTSVACDNTGARLGTAEATVTYPSSPPSG